MTAVLMFLGVWIASGFESQGFVGGIIVAVAIQSEINRLSRPVTQEQRNREAAR